MIVALGHKLATVKIDQVDVIPGNQYVIAIQINVIQAAIMKTANYLAAVLPERFIMQACTVRKRNSARYPLHQYGGLIPEKPIFPGYTGNSLWHREAQRPELA
jgi:hypothetical protein